MIYGNSVIKINSGIIKNRNSMLYGIKIKQSYYFIVFFINL